MKLGPLHHVAIAVPRIEDSLPFFRDTLGLSAEDVHELADQRVRVVFLGDARQRVELVDHVPRRGAHGMVAFIHPRASGGVLLELIDRASLRDSIP